MVTPNSSYQSCFSWDVCVLFCIQDEFDEESCPEGFILEGAAPAAGDAEPAAASQGANGAATSQTSAATAAAAATAVAAEGFEAKKVSLKEDEGGVICFSESEDEHADGEAGGATAGSGAAAAAAGVLGKRGREEGDATGGDNDGGEQRGNAKPAKMSKPGGDVDEPICFDMDD